MALAIVLLSACTEGAEPPALSLPIACDVGEDCWISSRPDIDPGPGHRAHGGSSHTRDDHDGTDVSVRDVGQAVATHVLAPAAGRVVRVRDGLTDGLLLARGPEGVADEECGNGVAIALDGDWELQLCHLLRGSVC